MSLRMLGPNSTALEHTDHDLFCYINSLDHIYMHPWPFLCHIILVLKHYDNPCKMHKTQTVAQEELWSHKNALNAVMHIHASFPIINESLNKIMVIPRKVFATGPRTPIYVIMQPVSWCSMGTSSIIYIHICTSGFEYKGLDMWLPRQHHTSLQLRGETYRM